MAAVLWSSVSSSIRNAERKNEMLIKTKVYKNNHYQPHCRCHHHRFCVSFCYKRKTFLCRYIAAFLFSRFPVSIFLQKKNTPLSFYCDIRLKTSVRNSFLTLGLSVRGTISKYFLLFKEKIEEDMKVRVPKAGV